MSKKGAGILFVSPQGSALFLRRTASAPDCPGCWDFPGGGTEDDELPEDTAAREAEEEIGFLPAGMMEPHTRTKGSALKGVAGSGAPAVSFPVSAGAPAVPPPPNPPPTVDVPQGLPDVDFTTFLQHVEEEFTPELNDEHDGWAWAPIETPPEPLHPGCRIALERISMDELGIARAIAAGRLTSPQRYENVWLFAIRITGTDTAYRDKLDEFVVRRPENYLNTEFLARCNGLPVIFRHPKKAILDSDEFSNRVVGTVFLPYIAGDEVWAIAKIFVDDVAQMMQDREMSTSPGVNFADFSVNAKLTLEDGSKVLIEGKPSLFDHVAICELGVWDKGGDPAGIRSESREDSAMTEEEKKAAEEKAKKDAAEKEEEAKKADAAKKDGEKREDADAGTALSKKIDAIGDSVKSMCDAVMGLGKRMDSLEDMEKKRGDAAKKDADEPEKKEEPKELAAADKAKKDGAKKDESKEEKKEEKESAMADSVAVRARIEEVARMIPKDIGDSDYQAMTDAQARADAIFADFGKHAPRPLQGETPAMYERRCVRTLKEHSPTWKGADLTSAFADEASFSIVRDQVYAEARRTAASPANVPAGQLRMIEKRRDGHIIREFVGDPRSWMDPLAGAVKLKAEGSWQTGNLGRTS